MEKAIAILTFAAVWIFCGWLMSLYYKQFMCENYKACTTCIHIKKEWNKRAWHMDGIVAVIALIFLFWLFK